jgi:DNA-binding NarL/FixJ family response regulator
MMGRVDGDAGTRDLGEGMRVLLATDSPDLGHALSLFLSERSIQVLEVTADPDDVIRRAAAGRPDAILVDWRLGEAVSTRVMDGLLGSEDPTPVIVLSTSQQRDEVHECGAAGYATLGDHPDSLIAVLNDVCGGGACD